MDLYEKIITLFVKMLKTSEYYFFLQRFRKIENKFRRMQTKIKSIILYNKYCLANARRNFICRVVAASLFTSSLLFAFNSNCPNAATYLKIRKIISFQVRRL